MKLSNRDRDILSTLCLRVRLLSLEQIVEHWWSGLSSGTRSARSRLAVLTKAGMLASARVPAIVREPLEEPIIDWQPGLPVPNLAAAAWKLQKRWEQTPKESTAYIATQEAAKLFGGTAAGTLKHQYQTSHDLGVSAMFLWLAKHHPEQVQYWIGEDILAPHRKGQKLPDAILASLPGATPQLVLEFGGAYSKARLEEFHKDCDLRALPYQVW